MSKLKSHKKNRQCKKNCQDILRPRTAYNFFYRYQRDLILKSKASSVDVNPDVDLLYQNSASLSWGYGTARKKRPHRKTHGLIGLQQLTKTVAKRWREADEKTKNTFILLAQQDKIRYKHETISQQNPWLITPHSLPTPLQSLQCQYNSPMPKAETPTYPRVESCVLEPVRRSNLMPTPACFNANITTTCTTDIYEPVVLKQESSSVSSLFCLKTNQNQQYTVDTTLSDEEYDMLDLLIHI